MATQITAHAFTFGALKYFRGNAHNVELAAYGEKKDPIGAKAHLDVQNKVKREHLEGRVKYNGITDVAWDQVSKANVEVNGVLKFFGLNGKAAKNASYEKAKSANLKLVNFAIHEGPLKTLLNKDAGGALKYLADEGNDGRIVSEVWVVMEAELAEHFSTSGSTSVSVSAAGSSLEVTANGSKQGAQTITLAKGTTFAYKLHKVKDWNKGKTKVEDLEADFKGMG